MWEVSNACFESLNFTVDISWRSAHVEGQAVNVSGNSYDITGLTPGVTYNITLVATGGGKRSDSVSISNTTLGPISGKYTLLHNNYYIQYMYTYVCMCMYTTIHIYSVFSLLHICLPIFLQDYL